MASPLKVRHTSCSSNGGSPPTLVLGLDTSVDGRLIVNGKDVSTQSPPQVDTTNVAILDTTIPPGGGTVFSPAHVAIAGLEKTITLTEQRLVLVHYHISWQVGSPSQTAWRYMVTSLWHNNAEIEDGRCVQGGMGTEFLGSNQRLWSGMLQAGAHTFVIKRRSGDTTYGGTVDYTAGYDFANKMLAVVVL